MTTKREPLYQMDLAVLEHLRKVGHITNMEANTVLKCRAVPKRVSKLRQHGYPITREFKRDTTGQRYARYVLDPAFRYPVAA